MSRGVLVWGYFSSFILLLGAIFMNMNLVAGKVLYLIGFFAFNFGYLIPLFFVIFQQNQENKIGVVLILGVLGFLCFLTGVSFFVVNWTGGIALIYIGGGMLILAILAIIFMSRRFYETHIDSWFPVLVFGVFIVVSLLTGMVHRQVMRVFSVSNKDSLELVKALKTKNERLFDNLNNMQGISYDDSLLIHKNVMTVHQKIVHLNDEIEHIKVLVLEKVKGDKVGFFQEMAMENMVPVQSNVEINAVNRVMLKRKSAKAKSLKKELTELRDTLLLMVPKEEFWLTNFINVSINTEAFELGKRRYNRSWEYQNFYDFPAITVINQLSSIQLKALGIESEMLHYYYQEALQHKATKVEPNE